MKDQLDIYEVEEPGGKKYTFNVLKNTTEPCSVCDVPACGREDILWYELNGERLAIIFDWAFFDLARDEFLVLNQNQIEPQDFPEFMKQWIELRAWEECWDYDGYELDIDDFIQAMELLRMCEMGKNISEEEIDDMQELARSARENKAVLKIVRG